jgi:class 3 adenylate cyclase
VNPAGLELPAASSDHVFAASPISGGGYEGFRVAENSNPPIKSLVEWAGGERVTLAIVFTDIVGSTATGRELGDEAMNRVWDKHFGQSRKLIARHAGCWVKGTGDGDLSVFKSVEAALDYALALQAAPGPSILKLRAGIHVGPVSVLDYDIRGEAVSFAARVGGANKGAEIWLSTQAIEHLAILRAERHSNLRWREHAGVELKGLGAYTLWSLASPGSGQTLGEIATDDRRLPEHIPSSKGRTVTATNVPIRVPTHFMGRDDALAAIEAGLGRYEGRVAIIALHGLRGVGKTTLAAVYAERHSGDYRATWWIRAQTEPTMRADLVALGARLGWISADEKEEPALATVMEQLRQDGEGILLIFDSAIKPDALK